MIESPVTNEQRAQCMFATNQRLPAGLAQRVVPKDHSPAGCLVYVADTGVENDDVLLTENRIMTKTERRQIAKKLDHHLPSVLKEVNHTSSHDMAAKIVVPVPDPQAPGDFVDQVVSAQAGDVVDLASGF